MRVTGLAALGCLCLTWHLAAQSPRPAARLGQEVAVDRHLRDGEEFKLPPAELVAVGRRLFEANWTEQDGGGRPLSKGTGDAVSDPSRPLKGPRAFNRISGPDANSCQGCHNSPLGITGGNGDVVTSAFELADRFDFVTFDRADSRVTAGAVDEEGQPASLLSIGNVRSTPGLFGAGYLEMLARQITDDLQRIRDTIPRGQARALVSSGLSFGELGRRPDGTWDVSRVEGLPEPSVAAGADGRPSLVVRPWGRSGSAASLREVINTSFNRHHGIQTAERFGANTDPDGDGVRNELTRGDVTAVALFLASLPVPGRVIPNDREIESAIAAGERAFDKIGCTTCHVPSLPLERGGWIYSEPGPYNSRANLRPGDARLLRLDLGSPALAPPRPATPDQSQAAAGISAYTDFKLHDITDPGDEAAREPLDPSQPASSPRFRAGNRRFLTRRLWAVGNERPYFHDGRFTTIRAAVLAHAGEALAARRSFEGLARGEQDALIEFLKSLQALPPGTKALVVDENGQPRAWPVVVPGSGTF